MNDTHQPPPTSGAATDEAPPESRRGLSAFTEVRRARQDRMVAGVATGVARRFGVDPVLVRVLFVVLCFVGLSGLILYTAGWLLLPAEDEPRSHVADWFGLEDSEQQVRDVGLVAAGVLAVLAVIGDGGWSWGNDPWVFWVAFWVVAPVALVMWFVRRGQRGTRPSASDLSAPPDAAPPTGPGTSSLAAPAPTDTVVLDGADGGHVPPAGPTVAPPLPAAPRTPREPFSWVPTLLTLSVAAIALAVTRLVADPEWTVYLAVALAVVGLGLVLSTFTRGGGPLVLVGLVLTALLAAGTLLPSPRLGDQRVDPSSALQLESSYSHGMGRFVLDLGDLDPDDLVGRSIDVETGLGETVVVLPDDLDVTVDASVRAGDLEVLGERVSGTAQELTTRSAGPALDLRIEHTAGRVEVTRR